MIRLKQQVVIYNRFDSCHDTSSLIVIGKYHHYLERQDNEMTRWKKNGNLKIPLDIEYTRENFPGFSSEELENLRKYRPSTIHEVSQLQGLSPECVLLLLNYITKRRRYLNKPVDNVVDELFD